MKHVVIALCAFALVSPVFAQEDLDGPPAGVVAAHNHVVRFLDLSEEQVTAWDEIYQIHRDAEQPLREQLRDLEAELGELIDAEDPDTEAIGEVVLEIADLRDAVREVHVVYHEDFVTLLDEEQVDRLGFIAHADDVQRFIPAFKLFELIR